VWPALVVYERADGPITPADQTNVRFKYGDAQVHRFTPGAGDVAVSRFGVMFFADPAAGFNGIGVFAHRRTS
jgi:hypothetical protein